MDLTLDPLVTGPTGPTGPTGHWTYWTYWTHWSLDLLDLLDPLDLLDLLVTDLLVTVSLLTGNGKPDRSSWQRKLFSPKVSHSIK